MSNYLHYFWTKQTSSAVSLPFVLDEVIGAWDNLRGVMRRNMPDAFSRDEWAYLITFLEKDNLVLPFTQSFGEQEKNDKGAGQYLIKPRGQVSLWLPNNVSLLGPLMLVLVSLSSNPLRIKGGMRSRDLCGAFIEFAFDNLPGGALKTYLQERVTLEFFDRRDVRNQALAQTAAVRIVFGSDDTARAIEALSHPVGSTGIYFVDKQSQAWVDKAALTDEVLATLIKVFAVYGQAGCTSPRKVVIVGGTPSDAVNLRNRLKELWPRVINKLVPAHIASTNIMAQQWGKALGWDTAATERNSAVLAAGNTGLPVFSSPMTLPIVAATREEAVGALPQNIQTIGYAANHQERENWARALAWSPVKRFVPLAAMHHFSHVWDGYDFWSQLFEKVTTVLV